MKPSLLAKLLAVMALVLPAASIASPSDSRKISIDVQTQVEPATAVGLIISNGKTVQKLNPQIEKASPGSIVVSFEVKESEIYSDSAASALVVSNRGEVVFGNVKLLEDPRFDEALSNVPYCKAEQVSSTALSGQLPLLEELYRIRLKRRDQTKAQVGAILDSDTLAKLRKLERGFGLAREKELSIDLPALELVDRLARLQTALRSWEKRKESKPASEESTEESAQ